MMDLDDKGIIVKQHAGKHFMKLVIQTVDYDQLVG